MQKNYFITFSLFLFSLLLKAQIVNTPPFILTVNELKAWTTTGPTASSSNIAIEPLASRFSEVSTQLNSSLTNDLEIAWLPDGMNNFGNYNGEQSMFNHYNFTHWAYIDKLIWFGGTASQTVQIPSAPWVNAAHKNGVKVFGNVFFAPTAWGGNTATVTNFLEKDASNNFIAVTKLKEIMEYYNFDGWFINEETSGLGATNGQLMYEFVRELTSEIEAIGGEVMWYDAMLLNGNVSWQNYLSGNNFMFLQNDENGLSSDGYEQRVSSSMFINFFWNNNSYTSTSNANATTIGRSPYEVFTGVDLWPGRNQANFETGGNTWMNDIHQSANNAFTSVGFFAPSAIYNNSQYSSFNTDPSDWLNFYNTERLFFSGSDYNPAISDVTGFKGVSNWVPATSVISSLPFETNFCTGHGRKKYTNGVESSSSDWHNMDEQDILPTWQFAIEGSTSINCSFDFDDAYKGGNSIKIDGTITGGLPSILKLYKTNLTVTNETELELTYKLGQIADTNLEVLVAFSDNPSVFIPYGVGASSSADWNTKVFDLTSHLGKEIVMIALQFSSTTTINSYAINIGKLKIHNNPALAIDSLKFNDLKIFPNPARGEVSIELQSNSNQELRVDMFNVLGSKVFSRSIINTGSIKEKIDLNGMTSGIYFINISDGDRKETRKLIIN